MGPAGRRGWEAKQSKALSSGGGGVNGDALCLIVPLISLLLFWVLHHPKILPSSLLFFLFLILV
jgi:hypothetical protein